jgi:hypothetical protein
MDWHCRSGKDGVFPLVDLAAAHRPFMPHGALFKCFEFLG